RAASTRKTVESSESARPLPGSWPAAQPATSPAAAPAASPSEQARQPTSRREQQQDGHQPSERRLGERRLGERHSGERPPSEAELARREEVKQYPYVAITLGASGIHPATSRLISLDAVTYNDAGEIGEATYLVF